MIQEEVEMIDGIPKIDIKAVEGEIEDTPTDCCPDPCYIRFPFLAGDDESPFWQGWAMLRLKTFRLIENTYFETAVITMILLSSLALVRPCLRENYFVYFFLKIFNPTFILAGSRRCSFTAPTNPSRYPVLHGPHFHRYIFHRDVDQVAGAWISEIFHKRLVLARFRHCNGNRLFSSYITFDHNNNYYGKFI